jgi:hypothetical protein
MKNVCKPVVEDEIAEVVEDEVCVLEVHGLGQHADVNVPDQLVESDQISFVESGQSDIAPQS